MLRNLILEYWIDEGWYVGRLREVPGVFSQGETLGQLEDNIREAYKLMRDEDGIIYQTDVITKEIAVEV
ncbi:type II toxin-antitoxin system HicB family antitoxin [Candidatus Magnetominusculus dajiuhuensis]|uniref:type II toxin-antitoxin system HicB family antitoxin n=1 Tax=Candidatus Magnetominusculus dajiuhuensis TaxID=3137712 RepID=UPI003B43AB7F